MSYKKTGKYNHVVIAFIISQISKANDKTDIKITELQNTGLKKASAIKLHRIVTIPTHLIQRELGNIPENYKNKINDKLIELFDIKIP